MLVEWNGVSVITPYFIKPTQAEMIDHFRRVAEGTSRIVAVRSSLLDYPLTLRTGAPQAGRQ